MKLNEDHFIALISGLAIAGVFVGMIIIIVCILF